MNFYEPIAAYLSGHLKQKLLCCPISSAATTRNHHFLVYHFTSLLQHCWLAISNKSSFAAQYQAQSPRATTNS
jgi:hypothetical protein